MKQQNAYRLNKVCATSMGLISVWTTFVLPVYLFCIVNICGDGAFILKDWEWIAAAGGTQAK